MAQASGKGKRPNGEPQRNCVLTDQGQSEGVLGTLVLVRVREQHVSQDFIRNTVLITTNQQERVLKPEGS